jgi:hypothetical protein
MTKTSSQLTRLEVNRILPTLGLAVGFGVLVASDMGSGVSVGTAVGSGVSVGGAGVSVGSGVSVGGIGVSVGSGVSVGGIGVSVGGTGVSVGGTGVSVGGTGVSVATAATSVGAGVAVGSSPQPLSTKHSSNVAATMSFHFLLAVKDLITMSSFALCLGNHTTLSLGHYLRSAPIERMHLLSSSLVTDTTARDRLSYAKWFS